VNYKDAWHIARQIANEIRLDRASENIDQYDGGLLAFDVIEQGARPGLVVVGASRQQGADREIFGGGGPKRLCGD
jgi:hypothetical protein